MNITIKQLPSTYPVKVSYMAFTSHGQFKIKTGPTEYIVRKILYGAK